MLSGFILVFRPERFLMKIDMVLIGWVVCGDWGF